MIAGVLGGIGDYTNIDPTVVRLLFIVALFFSFFTLAIAYVIAVVIVPVEGEFY